MAFDAGNFRTDEKAEEEGVWYFLGEDAYIKIARTNNSTFLRAWREIDPGQRRLAEEEALSPEDTRHIWSFLMAKGIIRDWKNIELDGEKLDCSYDNAYRLCYEVPDFRRMIFQMADERENFRQKKVSDSVGNSKEFSGGKSSTEG